VDNLAREALGMLRSYSGTATVKLDHAVRANPVAMALIGAGVAWMFLGPRLTGGSSSSERSSDYGSGYPSTGSQYTGSQYSSSGSQVSDYAGSPRHDSAGWTASSGAGSSDYGRVGYVPSDNDDDHSWSREAHGLRARAAQALHRIEEEARSYYDSLRRGLSSGAGSTRDFAAERASVISGFASDLRGRFAAGLDNLPPEARERVIAARERAYGAVLRAERMGRDMIRDPSRALEEHPFVAGAVAFALGAGVAAVLPSTEVENRTFGAERDRLMDEAARTFRQEREHAMRVAGSLGSAITEELKSVAKDTAGAVAETVTDKAQEAASRVKDRTSEEFRNAQDDSSAGGSGGSGLGSSPDLGGPGDPVIR